MSLLLSAEEVMFAISRIAVPIREQVKCQLRQAIPILFSGLGAMSPLLF